MTGSRLHTLWRYARQQRGALAFGIVLGPLAALGSLLQPWLAKSVIDALQHGRPLLDPVLALTALVIGSSGIRGVHLWLLERTAERIVLRVRLELMRRMLWLPVGVVHRWHSGDLTARVTADTTMLRAGAARGAVELVTGGIGLVGAVVLMALIDVRLLAVTLLAIAVFLSSTFVVLPRMRAATERAQAAVGATGARLEQVFAAVGTVKASQAESRELAQLTGTAGEAYRHGLTFARYRALIGTLTGLAMQAAFVVILAAGGLLVSQGRLALSALIAFLLYLFYLTSPIGSIFNGITQLNQALGAVGRLATVEALPVESDDPPMPSRAEDDRSAMVEFDDIRFRHAQDRTPALEGVSFRIPRGGLTAIVGPSGAGKSTIFALLERFHEPQAGTIRLAGHRLPDLPRAELRRRIGYVEQDAPVLAGSLLDNLRYAAPTAGLAEVRAVLSETRLEEFAAALPRGLDTDVGPHGVALSGGERQRLALARALLRKPEVLLLDEVTAQLDALNEHALQEALARAAEHCTVIVVAHRLSTVRTADRIIVLDAGRVRAIGAHPDLERTDPLYRRLAETQLGTETQPGKEEAACASRKNSWTRFTSADSC